MKKNSNQDNRKGHNIAEDYVGGDKVNALIGKIIGDHNITNIHIASSNKFNLSKEDEEKFKRFIPESKIAQFKNLIERIEFLCDLGEYEDAKGFIEQANKIHHNHPILLILNGLCEYATLDKIEVIKYPRLINKTTKLFEKAREVDYSLSNFYGWNESISFHFYGILIKYIESIKNQVSFYFQVKKHIDYYKAIAKHLIHLENCYKINKESFYLKEFVLHLSGHKGYAWFNSTQSGQILDLGIGIFDGGASKQLSQMVMLIQEQEPDYDIPEVRYGNYFDDPKPKNEVNKDNRRVQIAIFILIFLVSAFFYLIKIPFYLKALLIINSLSIWVLSHPFGEKLSVFQRIFKFLMKKFLN